MIRTKIHCDLCGKDISRSNYQKHLNSHESNPDYHRLSQSIDHEGLNCKHCNKLCKNRNSLAQHECRCKENPNRINIVSNFKPNVGHKGRNQYTKAKELNLPKPVVSEETRKKLSDARKKYNLEHKEELREKISKTCLQKSKEGTGHTSLAKNMHYSYKGYDLHGKGELAYAKYLDSLNINGKRCDERFSYHIDNIEHYYTPDFYLIDTEEYVEIKGYKRTKDLLKWGEFPKDKKLIVLFGKDLKRLGII